MSTPAAGEIIVHQCVVRVIRRGGWGWGTDPRGLIQRVLDALPDLLAEQFDEIVSGDGPNVEITEPVRLTARLSRHGSLASAGFALVLESSSGSVPEPVPVVVPAAVAVSAADEITSEVHVVGESTLPAPVVLFGELAERGELAALLALLPGETLRAYLSVLLSASSVAVPAQVISEFAGEFARRLSLRQVLATRDDLVELLGSLPDLDMEVEAATVTAPVADMAGETRVCAALPFLLVGPLARTGYLDAIGPALSGVDLLGQAPLFAAALAYKVLGGRRTPEDEAAAAVFAGLDSVPDLTGFARLVQPALPVLDGVLALSLCRGHDPADPLLVVGVDGGVLLVDAQGMFPVAWALSTSDLLPHWEACGRPPVLVCDSPLPSSCLRDLAAAGVRFVTDVRPLRDDPVSRMPWRAPLWTSGDVSPRLAAQLPVHADQLADLVRSLFTARRSAPLERSVALAASLSLGMIAWQLWRGETPDPVLALTRFADLDATVEFTSRAVKVRLPLGRRHADLWHNGLLADVQDVVWLGGRTLTFSGG